MRDKILPLLKWMLFPLFDTANQVCMKYLGLVTGDMSFGIGWLRQVLTSPYWWGAIGADVGSFLMWMLILKKSNLSFAAPFISMQYVTILIASHLLFHEPIHWLHVVGVALIVVGLVVAGAEDSAEKKNAGLG
jgi:drug/metabolite transporter (DMT)-like permease